MTMAAATMFFKVAAMVALLASLFLVGARISPDVDEQQQHSSADHDLQMAGGVSALPPVAKTPSPAAGHAPAPSPAPAAAAPIIIKDAATECEGVCKGRCADHSRQNLCNRACGTCCKRCKCVPPGTSGHRELCGVCYTNMLTHGNRTKCP